MQINLDESGEWEEKDPFSEAILEARRITLSRLSEAKTLHEFMKLTYITRALNPVSMEWMREYYPPSSDISPQQFLDYFESQNLQASFLSEAGRASGMRNFVADTPPEKGRVKIVVHKFPDTQNGLTEYRVIGAFHGNTNDYDIPYNPDLNSNTNHIYIRLHAACNHQACEAILKGETSAVYEVEDMTYSDLFQALGFDSGLTQQNFRTRNALGEVLGHTNEQLYLLFALKGGFSNESDRYKIPLQL